MNKLLIVIIVFIISAVSINAQQTKRPWPPKLDDFDKTVFVQEKVTTDSIKCSSASNIYARINIHRNYGIPRFGIITDCSNQILDTVWYVPNNITSPQSGAIPSPLFTDTAITVWWKEGQFTVQIMEVLTGTVILSETRQGQASSLFASDISEINLADSTKIEFRGSSATPVKDNNTGEIINYNHISDGLYWVYIIDGVDNVVRYMKTIRKGNI